MNRPSQRTIGKAMLAIGMLSVGGGITVVVVAQTLIDQVETSVDSSLVLTTEALDLVVDSLLATSTIADTVQSAVRSTSSSLQILTESADQTALALEHSDDFLGRSLPDALDAVSKVLPTIESIAGSIDTALRTISRAPFGPDYQPDQPFDEAIADLSAAVAPLPAELRLLSGDLGGIARSTRAMSGQLAVLVRDVDQLDRQLRQVSTLLDRYVASAVEARGLASTSRRDLASSARWTRFLMTALATLFALGQIVPIWLGVRLMGGSVDRRQSTSAAHP